MHECHKIQVLDSGLWSKERKQLVLKQRLKIPLASNSLSKLFLDFELENDEASC